MLASVSIIIPAHNARATLDDTLASVVAQTSPQWEAIVIENGSTDDTTAIARTWAARDPRISVTHSDPGVSVARNQGLCLARHPWVLFLDADDWILPTHLERLTTRLAEDPRLDAAHCGWRRIGPEGVVLSEEFGPVELDLFPRFARTCALVIHSCITRRALIDEAGRFDPTLRTCEDWDLWQRLARLGCQFGAVREALACYRVRPGSASMNAAQLIADSRQVIRRGFSADPRLRSPFPAHEAGTTGEDVEETLLYTIAWAAGLAIGGGIDPTPLLDLVETRPGTGLDPFGVAGCIHGCAMLPAALPISAWADRFDLVDPLLHPFLEALEARTCQRGLARSTHGHLLRLALASSTRPHPFTLGPLHSLRIEITEPIPDLRLPPATERVHCLVCAEGEKLGTLELPVIDGLMTADLLADAIAGALSWAILGRFFGRTVYPSLLTEKSADGWSVIRDGQPLASRLAGNGAISWAEAHDRIGWTVFLQEAWGEPALEADDFYHADPTHAGSGPSDVPVHPQGWLWCEISDELPQSWAVERGTIAVLTVGGVAVAAAELPAAATVTGPSVRAALTTEARFELCCACVREGILGRPFRDGLALRARLAERAAERRASAGRMTAKTDKNLVPTSASVIADSSAAEPATLVMARRPGPCGTSVSRRLALPVALLPELMAAATRQGQPVVETGTPPRRIVYAPELFWREARRPVAAVSPIGGKNGTAGESYSREFFEDLFRETPNPWLYTSAYEQKKYEQTLEVLPAGRFHNALELACAEGHFTVQLAPRVDRLLATDFSTTALARAARRCAAHDHVSFAELDLLTDPISGSFDLIVCSEVLYYAGTRSHLRSILARIAAALAPGGYFVTAHAHLVADEPGQPGFDWDLPFGARRISDELHRSARLRLVRELRTPLYRVQLYQRQPLWRRWLGRTPVQRSVQPPPTELPPHVAAHVHWHGGLPQRFSPAVEATTARLPILMYHHIAPDSTSGNRRYRTTPEMFDAQLALLAQLGFRGILLDEWRRAMQTRQPLPGRCVALTFDDGYRDFLDHAWPSLQRRGFVATVFLPTGHVGGVSEWDAAAGESHPLMNWDDVRRLRNEGIELGSHSVSHPALTSLAPTDMAREGLRSRLALEEKIGGPVTSFAYPYGEVDQVVQTMMGACGYTLGVTCQECLSELHDSFLALPRLEVRGDLDLKQFEGLLEAS